MKTRKGEFGGIRKQAKGKEQKKRHGCRQLVGRSEKGFEGGSERREVAGGIYSKCIFMEMIKKKYICVFKSDGNDFVVLGSTRVGVRRLAGLQ